MGQTSGGRRAGSPHPHGRRGPPGAPVGYIPVAVGTPAAVPRRGRVLTNPQKAVAYTARFGGSGIGICVGLAAAIFFLTAFLWLYAGLAPAWFYAYLYGGDGSATLGSRRHDSSAMNIVGGVREAAFHPSDQEVNVALSQAEAHGKARRDGGGARPGVAATSAALRGFEDGGGGVVSDVEAEGVGMADAAMYRHEMDDARPAHEFRDVTFVPTIAAALLDETARVGVVFPSVLDLTATHATRVHWLEPRPGDEEAPPGYQLYVGRAESLVVGALVRYQYVWASAAMFTPQTTDPDGVHDYGLYHTLGTGGVRTLLVTGAGATQAVADCLDAAPGGWCAGRQVVVPFMLRDRATGAPVPDVHVHGPGYLGTTDAAGEVTVAVAPDAALTLEATDQRYRTAHFGRADAAGPTVDLDRAPTCPVQFRVRAPISTPRGAEVRIAGTLYEFGSVAWAGDPARRYPEPTRLAAADPVADPAAARAYVWDAVLPHGAYVEYIYTWGSANLGQEFPGIARAQLVQCPLVARAEGRADARAIDLALGWDPAAPDGGGGWTPTLKHWNEYHDEVYSWKDYHEQQYIADLDVDPAGPGGGALRRGDTVVARVTDAEFWRATRINGYGSDPAALAEVLAARDGTNTTGEPKAGAEAKAEPHGEPSRPYSARCTGHNEDRGAARLPPSLLRRMVPYAGFAVANATDARPPHLAMSVYHRPHTAAHVQFCVDGGVAPWDSAWAPYAGSLAAAIAGRTHLTWTPGLTPSDDQTSATSSIGPPTPPNPAQIAADVPKPSADPPGTSAGRRRDFALDRRGSADGPQDVGMDLEFSRRRTKAHASLAGLVPAATAAAATAVPPFRVYFVVHVPTVSVTYTGRDTDRCEVLLFWDRSPEPLPLVALYDFAGGIHTLELAVETLRETEYVYRYALRCPRPGTPAGEPELWEATPETQIAVRALFVVDGPRYVYDYVTRWGSGADTGAGAPSRRHPWAAGDPPAGPDRVGWGMHDLWSPASIHRDADYMEWLAGDGGGPGAHVTLELPYLRPRIEFGLMPAQDVALWLDHARALASGVTVRPVLWADVPEPDEGHTLGSWLHYTTATAVRNADIVRQYHLPTAVAHHLLDTPEGTAAVDAAGAALAAAGVALAVDAVLLESRDWRPSVPWLLVGAPGDAVAAGLLADACAAEDRCAGAVAADAWRGAGDTPEEGSDWRAWAAHVYAAGEAAGVPVQIWPVPLRDGWPATHGAEAAVRAATLYAGG